MVQKLAVVAEWSKALSQIQVNKNKKNKWFIGQYVIKRGCSELVQLYSVVLPMFRYGSLD